MDIVRKTLLVRLPTVAVAITSAASSVHSATVTAPSGSVLINQGDGFKSALEVTRVVAGTQVFVRPGAQAIITYSSTCRVRIGEGRVWVIASKTPCAAGTQMIDFTQRMGATEGEDLQNLDWDPVVTTEPQPALPEQAAETGFNGTTLLVGGLVIGGAVGIIAAVSNGSDDDKPAPASP